MILITRNGRVINADGCLAGVSGVAVILTAKDSANIKEKLLRLDTLVTHRLEDADANTVSQAIGRANVKYCPSRDRVYEAIDSERKFQDCKWGSVKDHPHEVGAWILIMEQLIADARKAWVTKSNDIEALAEIRKVAAVAVACGEQHGFANRYFNTSIEPGEGRNPLV